LSILNKQENKENRNHNKNSNEWRLIKSIKGKLEKNNLMITQSYKGKTLVILEKPLHDQYIQEFIKQNNFKSISGDPTQNYHKKIQTLVQKCNNVIQKQKCKYYNNNPEQPNLKSFNKIT
jgi:hypothetical protein